MLTIVEHLTANAPLIIAAGFLIGFLVGLTGVGAGALTTPLLITGFGLNPVVAVGTDLLFAAITKASAAWRHHSLANIDYSVLGWLAAGSLPGAGLMFAWLAIAKPEMRDLTLVIRQGLAIALVFSAFAIALYPLLIRALAQRSKPPMSLAATAGRSAAGRLRWLTLMLGIVLGSLVALTSVGAGSIGVTFLTALYPTMLTRRIVGTDVVHAVPLTLVTGLGHAGLGNVDFTVLGLLLAGSIPGIALGARMTGHLPDWLLRIALAIVLLNAAVLLWLRS